MKIAITGATGFIGRHVLAELARHPVEVIALTRKSVTDLPGSIKVIPLDISQCSEHTFDTIGRPDVLLHLAWGGLPNYRSLHHFERELPLHYHFLSTLVRSGLAALVTTGTCFEYGLQNGPLHEGLPSIPDNPYGFAKDTLRVQLQYLQRQQPFTLSWARLFYLYGQGQAGSSLLPQLRAAVEQKQARFNMSGGEQLRDYLPVEQVACALVSLALHKADIGVVNISSGKPISVRKLVEGWIAEHQWNIELNLGHFPYPDYEPFAFWGERRKFDDFLATVAAAS